MTQESFLVAMLDNAYGACILFVDPKTSVGHRYEGV
jgi:hypothetical protein